MAHPTLRPDAPNPRWRLIRDLFVFSAKASIEALRDVILIPLAFVAGLFGLVAGRDDPERPFREMLRRGQRFDRWLNLFGTLGDAPGRSPGSVDPYFERLEAIVVEQHARGGITAGAKDAIDRALDKVSGTRATQAEVTGGGPKT